MPDTNWAAFMGATRSCTNTKYVQTQNSGRKLESKPPIQLWKNHGTKTISSVTSLLSGNCYTGGELLLLPHTRAEKEGLYHFIMVKRRRGITSQMNEAYSRGKEQGILCLTKNTGSGWTRMMKSLLPAHAHLGCS